MAALFIIALIITVAKLWSDVRALRQRVLRLEWNGAPPVAPPAWQPYPFQPAPDAWQPYPTQSQPEPWQPPVTPEPSGPQATARIVYDEPQDAAAAEPAEYQHPNADLPEPVTPDPVFTPAPPPPPTRTLSFEDIFGRKLPIWAGGITLAVCGFLIVKYSIEAGLISPIVRVIGGLLFGSGLIAGAEAARQNEAKVRDPRVAQALSGAGVATLYASILVATNLYHLIPPLAAFLFMAATTVLAGALSIRFGAPSAVLGLVGGLAAPALVGSGNPSVPLLAAYLSLTVGGLATLGRTQRWWWLGVAALAGGFAWGLVLILNGALGFADSLSVGGFLLLLGVGLPVLLFGGERGVFSPPGRHAGGDGAARGAGGDRRLHDAALGAVRPAEHRRRLAISPREAARRPAGAGAPDRAAADGRLADADVNPAGDRLRRCRRDLRPPCRVAGMARRLADDRHRRGLHAGQRSARPGAVSFQHVRQRRDAPRPVWHRHHRPACRARLAGVGAGRGQPLRAADRHRRAARRDRRPFCPRHLARRAGVGIACRRRCCCSPAPRAIAGSRRWPGRRARSR